MFYFYFYFLFWDVNASFFFFFFLSRPRYCSDRAGQVKLVTFHICHCFLDFQTQLNLLFFSPGLHDLLFLLYFNFTIKTATFVAIFTWVHLCRLPCARTGKYPEAIQNKRKRKHSHIWKRKTRATFTIALTQNITIYQNGPP